jgi:hypothetical protein
MLRFSEPFYLTVGIGIPVEVTSVEQAYALLNDWPMWRRDRSHGVALNVCRAAIAGEIDIDTAQASLAAFARRIGHESTSDSVPAWSLPAHNLKPVEARGARTG